MTAELRASIDALDAAEQTLKEKREVAERMRVWFRCPEVVMPFPWLGAEHNLPCNGETSLGYAASRCSSYDGMWNSCFRRRWTTKSYSVLCLQPSAVGFLTGARRCSSIRSGRLCHTGLHRVAGSLRTSNEQTGTSRATGRPGILRDKPSQVSSRPSRISGALVSACVCTSR